MSYKRIGILGGMSPESTAEFYSLLIKKHFAQFKDYSYPEIVIYSVNFAEVIGLQEADNIVSYANELTRGIKALESAGSELIVIASNTPHMIFDDLQRRTHVPMLSMPLTVMNEAVKLKLKRLLLLGTKFTMQKDFYQKAFLGSNIEIIVPTASEQETVNNIVYKELVVGDIKGISRQKLVKIISSYSVDGVILGCTELPLIIRQDDVSAMLLDTVDIFTDATLVSAKV